MKWTDFSLVAKTSGWGPSLPWILTAEGGVTPVEWEFSAESSKLLLQTEDPGGKKAGDLA